MRKIYLIPLFLGMILVSSCESGSTANWDKPQVKSAVESMLQGYFDDIRQSGLTAEFAYLDSTEDFFWVPPGYGSSLDYDSVRTILEYNAAAFTSVSFNWEKLDIYPLSGEIATYTGVVRGKIVDTSGMQSNVHMIETGTAIKRKGGWKILSGQSRDFPGVSSR